MEDWEDDMYNYRGSYVENDELSEGIERDEEEEYEQHEEEQEYVLGYKEQQNITIGREGLLEAIPASISKHLRSQLQIAYDQVYGVLASPQHEDLNKHMRDDIIVMVRKVPQVNIVNYNIPTLIAAARWLVEEHRLDARTYDNYVRAHASDLNAIDLLRYIRILSRL